MYLYTLLYDHKVIRVYIEIFVAEHRAVVAKVYAINVIDFLCHREARLRIFVQVIMQLLVNLSRLQRLFN